MTPKQATKAHEKGDLREGTLVNQMYGFLCGERFNGRVLGVDCHDGVVQGLAVQWPDETTPDKVRIEDVALAEESHKPSLRDRFKTIFSRAQA
jgi:hypothetical protein